MKNDDFKINSDFLDAHSSSLLPLALESKRKKKQSCLTVEIPNLAVNVL